MLSRAPVQCFLATSDPERARRFYEETLGLSFVSDDHFALVFALEGALLRVQKVPVVSALPYTALGWRVADLRAEAEDLLAKGVDFERYSFLQQDSLGIWTAPDGALVVWFKDPDGHLLSLTQEPG